MKKFLVLLFSVFLCSLFFAGSVFAAVIGADKNFLMNENVNDDAYFAGSNVSIDGDILGDAYIVGNNVVISGNVRDDLVVIGSKVNVIGSVGGDVRILGGQVSILGNVGEDVVVVGGQVDVGKNSIIGGNVLTASGAVSIDGEVKKDLTGFATSLELNGKIGNNVDLTTGGDVYVAPLAKVTGDFKYSAPIESKIPQNVVGGKTIFTKSVVESAEGPLRHFVSTVTKQVWSYLSALLILALLCAVFGNYPLRIFGIVKQNILKTLGVGFLAIISCFVGGLIALITIIGLPLGLIAIAGGFIFAYFGKIVAAMWIGGYFGRFDKQKNPNKFKTFLWCALGLLAYYIVALIPFVGWILAYGAALVGIGAVVYIKVCCVETCLNKSKK